MDMMIGRGYPVTVIKAQVRGSDSLFDFCKQKAIIPNRWSNTRYLRDADIEAILTVAGYFELLEAAQEFIATERGVLHDPHYAPRVSYDADALDKLKQALGAMGDTKRAGISAMIDTEPRGTCFDCAYWHDKQDIELIVTRVRNRIKAEELAEIEEFERESMTSDTLIHCEVCGAGLWQEGDEKPDCPICKAVTAERERIRAAVKEMHHRAFIDAQHGYDAGEIGYYQGRAEACEIILRELAKEADNVQRD